MKKLSTYPEVIAAIIAVVGGFLFSVILGYLEGRIGFTAVVTVVVALLLLRVQSHSVDGEKHSGAQAS